MGHLNGILARVGGNLNNNFQKSQMPGGLPGGGGGMLKFRFDRYIIIIRGENLATLRRICVSDYKNKANNNSETKREIR